MTKTDRMEMSIPILYVLLRVPRSLRLPGEEGREKKVEGNQVRLVKRTPLSWAWLEVEF